MWFGQLILPAEYTDPELGMAVFDTPPACHGRNRMDAKRAVENGIFFQWIFFEGFAEKSSSFFPFGSSSVSA